MKEKIRYDLVPAHGIKEISRVLTRKLDTYEENQIKTNVLHAHFYQNVQIVKTIQK